MVEEAIIEKPPVESEKAQLDNKPTEFDPNISETQTPETEAAATYLKEQGVDLTNDDVQEAILEGISSDDLVAKFGKAPEVISDAKKEEEESAAAAEAEAKKAKETEEDEDEEPSLKPGDKVRKTVEDEEEAAVYALQRAMAKREGRKVSFMEAARAYDSTQPKADVDKKGDPVEDETTTQFKTSISEVDQKITDVRAKIKTARDDAEFDEAFDLQEALSDLKVEKMRLSDKAEAYESNKLATTEAEYNDGVTASSGKVSEKYPALGKSDSLANLAFKAFINSKDPNDPIFNNTDWPESLSDEFAELHPEVSQSPAPKSTDDQPKVDKQTKTAQPKVRRESRAAMLDGGAGGSESPATTDEGSKPPTMDEALAAYEEVTKDMTLGQREAFDRTLYG